MQITLEIPQYDSGSGFEIKWENGFEINTKVENEEIIISANKAGLVSLAKQLLSLAQENVPSGYHFHFDEYNSLEEGSFELIIKKV